MREYEYNRIQLGINNRILIIQCSVHLVWDTKQFSVWNLPPLRVGNLKLNTYPANSKSSIIAA